MTAIALQMPVKSQHLDANTCEWTCRESLVKAPQQNCNKFISEDNFDTEHNILLRQRWMVMQHHHDKCETLKMQSDITLKSLRYEAAFWKLLSRCCRKSRWKSHLSSKIYGVLIWLPRLVSQVWLCYSYHYHGVHFKWIFKTNWLTNSLSIILRILK